VYTNTLVTKRFIRVTFKQESWLKKSILIKAVGFKETNEWGACVSARQRTTANWSYILTIVSVPLLYIYIQLFYSINMFSLWKINF